MGIRCRAAAVIVAGGAIFLYGCQEMPPSVAKKSDIDRLPVSTVSISARRLSDSDILSLARFKNLRILDFAIGNAVEEAWITDEGLTKLSQLDLMQLDSLNLAYCARITDAGAEHLSKLDSLTWLGLAGCPQITDRALPQILKMKGLTKLDLRGCAGVTDDGIQELAGKANWEKIDLGGCSNVTAAGVAKLQAKLPQAKVEKDDYEWSLHKR